MKSFLCAMLVLSLFRMPVAFGAETPGSSPPLGLPPLVVPAENPQTPEKIQLGDRLFHDKRFSSTGTVNCATCHEAKKAFTDSPLPVSEGINELTGTRNAPTVINAAYFDTQFWDGRSPSLEDQALHPFVNPVEMGLENHDPILKIVRTDPEYVDAFKNVFGNEHRTAGEHSERDGIARARVYLANSFTAVYLNNAIEGILFQRLHPHLFHPGINSLKKTNEKVECQRSRRGEFAQSHDDICTLGRSHPYGQRALPGFILHHDDGVGVRMSLLIRSFLLDYVSYCNLNHFLPPFSPGYNFRML